jgi:predicted nucleotidyltransferase
VPTPLRTRSSFARLVDPNSDIDLLVEDSAGRSDLEIWRMAREWIKDVEVDVVMADALDAEMLEFMRLGVTNE